MLLVLKQGQAYQGLREVVDEDDRELRGRDATVENMAGEREVKMRSQESQEHAVPGRNSLQG